MIAKTFTNAGKLQAIIYNEATKVLEARLNLSIQTTIYFTTVPLNVVQTLVYHPNPYNFFYNYILNKYPWDQKKPQKGTYGHYDDDQPDEDDWREEAWDTYMTEIYPYEDHDGDPG